MSPPMPEMRCDHCREIIGVYEPMIVRIEDEDHRTSQAADPSRALEAHQRFHSDCYVELNGSLP